MVMVSVLLAPRPGSRPATILERSCTALSPQRALINQYCVSCHNQKLKTAGLMLDALDLALSVKTRQYGKKSCESFGPA